MDSMKPATRRLFARFPLAQPWLHRLLPVAQRYAAVPVVAFFLVYALQATVFRDVASLPRLHYPFYLFMLTSAFLYFLPSGEQRQQFSRASVAGYGVFLVLALAGTFWRPEYEIHIGATQRMFMYVLGFVTALQVRTAAHRRGLYLTMVASAVIISLWTIASAIQSDFAYRGATGVNPNFVSRLIGIGLIPVYAYLLGSGVRRTGWKFWSAGLVLGLGLYATFILASRGVLAALAAAMGLVLIRSALSMRDFAKKAVATVLLAAVALFLPGGLAVVNRSVGEIEFFKGMVADKGQVDKTPAPAPVTNPTDTAPVPAARPSEAPAKPVETPAKPAQGQTTELNGRWPLWEAAFKHFAEANPLVKLFGGGMGTSENVVNRRADWVKSMHNTYLQVLMDGGIFGLLAFCLLLAGVTWHSLRSRGPGGIAAAGLVLFLGTVMLTATIIENNVFWIVLGVAMPRVAGEGTEVLGGAAAADS
ncbi:MAG TPA: O-antigen ligase family protein [Symbiobacteriaceae bacterium]|nr:O-antigen ligase family protein [Symbiobacteriaceae bacterium]